MAVVKVIDELRRQPGLALLGCMLAWCVGLILFRVERTGSFHFMFLIWNLFLACVPLFASRLLHAAHMRRIPSIVQFGLVAVWLLFLPNAPYVLTDLVHLQASTPLLYWFDMALLLSCGAVGLVLGYFSMFDVHQIVERRFGARIAWATASAALLLSGFGIYLGRVLRWNSWDIVTNPRGLLDSVADYVFNPGAYLQIWAISGLCGAGLLLGYVTLHWMTANRPVRQWA
jgi:uncharacterized membrane protein